MLCVVPRERIELSWVSPYDFESYAYTSSAIEANVSIINKMKSIVKGSLRKL